MPTLPPPRNSPPPRRRTSQPRRAPRPAAGPARPRRRNAWCGFLPVRVGERQRQGARGVVEVPMRIVGGEQQPVPADPLDVVDEMLARLGLLRRLGGDPNVVADIFGGRPAEMRRLVAHAAPDL